MSQYLENSFACSDVTSKTPKATRRLNNNGHGSCLDVIFSNCEMSKSGIVLRTVSDHVMVYAVNGDDSEKYNANIRDYQKLENPETFVRAVIYLQNLFIKNI